MIRSIFVLCAILVVILVGDAIWLSSALGPIYAPLMGDLLTSDIKLVPAIGFYLVFAIGLWYLIIMPGITAGHGHLTIALRSLGFGLCCYGTYDLTNWAVIEGWDWRLSVIDMAWGSSIAGLAGFTSSFAHSQIKPKSITK